MKSDKKIFLFFLFFSLVRPVLLPAGNPYFCKTDVNDAEREVYVPDMRDEMEFLCSEICEGRASFTRGAGETAFHFVHNFAQRGLIPVCGDSFINSCTIDGKTFHNVVGMIPSTVPSATPGYIFICAHYDGIGKLEGQLYPGADSNASGLVALLTIADCFRYLTAHGCQLRTNLVFVATDGKQHSLGGARGLWDTLCDGFLMDPYRGGPIKKEEIAMFANIDILGGTDAPVMNGRKEYMIMLGGRAEDNGALRAENLRGNLGMDLAFDYYGSESFTDLFLRRISDQKPFLEGKVPCVMFTSGISMNTNKTGDNLSAVDFEILKKRTILIFHWLYRMTREAATTTTNYKK